jgi:hypothetical protein
MLPRWKRAVVSTVVLTVIATVGMELTSMGPRLVLVAALGVVVGASAWLVLTLARSAAPAAPWETDDEVPGADHDIRLRSGWLGQRIPSGPHDRRTAELLHARLIELVDDRLIADYGIDRHRDPDAARATMGEELASFVDDPGVPASLTDLPTLERIMTRIEQL